LQIKQSKTGPFVLRNKLDRIPLLLALVLIFFPDVVSGRSICFEKNLVKRLDVRSEKACTTAGK
jgi:hypothetical protein